MMARNLSFSWQTPMALNGNLIGYQLSCQPLLSGIPLPQTLTLVPFAVMAMLSDLFPGVGYNCSIVARNVAAPSDPVYINGTTQETGTSVYTLYSVLLHMLLVAIAFNQSLFESTDRACCAFNFCHAKTNYILIMQGHVIY